jgi:hypothetical protein
MHMRGEQILLLLFFLVILSIVVVSLYYRYRKQQLLHQERLLAMEKGVPVPPSYAPAPWSPRIYLLRGLLWTFTGLALSIFLLGFAASTQRHRSAVSILYQAKDMSFRTGISLEEAKKIVEKDQNSETQGMPYGVALLGLIPIGVGAAYLIFYNTGDKRISDSQSQSMHS